MFLETAVFEKGHAGVDWLLMNSRYSYEIGLKTTKIWFSHFQLNYRKLSNTRRTKSQILNVSRLGLQLSLRNILKPSAKWKMKMQLEQRRQAVWTP